MRKRNLSEFMCIEMLYDYKSGKLDALRQQAVEEGLQNSPRVREELRKLSIGMTYCEKLKMTTVTEPLVDYIMTQPKPTEKAISKFKWNGLPQPVRWAFEAVVVAIAISLFVTQMPELFRGSGKKEDSGFVVKKFDLKPMDSKIDVAKTVAKQPETPKDVAPAPVAGSAPTQASTTPVPAPAPTTAPVQAPVPSVVATAPVVSPIPAPTPAAVAKTEEKTKPAKKGNAYLYRMVLRSDNVDQVTPSVTQLIKSLGGEKAGEVELGWRRKGGSYYHFSLPKANNQAFQDALKKFGQFSIVKSPHPRVMPEDTERFILWIEENKSAKSSAASKTESDENAQPADEPTPSEATPEETSGETDAQ